MSTRVHLLIWVLGSALYGAYLASFGYDPTATSESVDKSPRGLIRLAGFVAVVTAAQALLVPLFYRLNEGKFDRQRVRAGAALWFVQGMLIAAVVLAAVGVYELAGRLTGGWPGDRGDMVFGAALGAALGLVAGFGVSRIGLSERWRAHQREAEPVADGA